MAIVSVGSAWSLPDAVAIAVHLPDTVKRNTPQVAGFVQYLKNPTLVFREGDFLKGHLVNGAFPAIELADLEPAPAKLPVVADAAQQFVDRLHGGDSKAGRASAQAGRLSAAQIHDQRRQPPDQNRSAEYAQEADHPDDADPQGSPLNPPMARRSHQVDHDEETQHLQPRNFVGQDFWARGYWVSTVGKNEEAIRRYIREQEKEDQRVEQLELAAL